MRDHDRTFLALYSAHRAAIDRHLSRRGLTGADREDAAQLVWTIAYQRHESLRDPAKFASWLHGVAWRVAGTERRGRARYIRALERLSYAENQRATERRDADVETRIFVEEITRGLPPEQAEVLARMCAAGDTGREVAEELGLNINSVHTRLRLARTAVQAKTEERRRRSAALAALSFSRLGARLPWLVPAILGALCWIVLRLACGATPSADDPTSSGSRLADREIVLEPFAAVTPQDTDDPRPFPRSPRSAEPYHAGTRSEPSGEEIALHRWFGTPTAAAAPSSVTPSPVRTPPQRSPLGDDESSSPLAPTCADCETCRDDLEALRSDTDRGVSMIRTAFSAQACVLLCSMVPACVGDEQSTANSRSHAQDSRGSEGNDAEPTDTDDDAQPGSESSDNEWDTDASSEEDDGSETDSDGGSESQGDDESGGGQPLTPECAEIDLDYCEEFVSDHCGYYPDALCDELVAECYPFTPEGLGFQPLLVFCRSEVGPERPAELWDCLAGTSPVDFHACWNQAFVACNPLWHGDYDGSDCAVVQSRCYPQSTVERLEECLGSIDHECPDAACQTDFEDCLAR